MMVLVCLVSSFHRVRYFYISFLKQYHDFLALLGVPVAYMERSSSYEANSRATSKKIIIFCVTGRVSTVSSKCLLWSPS